MVTILRELIIGTVWDSGRRNTRSDELSSSSHFQPQQWQVLLEGKKRPTLMTCPPRCSTLLVEQGQQLA